MADLTFLELSGLVLREENRPLAPSEIWQIAEAKGYTKRLTSQGKTPAQTLYAAIFTDARDNPQSPFVKVGARPNRYFLKKLAQGRSEADLEKAAAIEPPIPLGPDYREIDLHSFLVRFIWRQFNAYSKTIRHENAAKKEFGQWVHPDMIAVYYPIKDWNEDVLDLSRVTGDLPIKLYSFEVKRQLSFANLREAFFQAVSNSSWAHEGYLVAADIKTDEDFRSELRRLSSSFGIGVIELDIQEPDSSSVVFPARERDVLDWEALDKLSMNPNVRSFLRRVTNDLRVNEIRKEEFDPVLESEKLSGSIRQKQTA